MEYCIKAATIEDKEFIYQTKSHSIRRYVEPIWGWNEGDQRRYFEEDFILLANFKVILLGDEAAGYMETYENDELVNITEVHINPAAQGRGMGSRIINGIVNEAKAHGKKVTLGCFKKNDGAVRLYQRLGFRITDETQTHFALEHS